MMSKQGENTAFAFAKYSELRFLQDLQQGNLYFNTLQYFAKAEESNGIGDRYENVYKQTFGPSVRIDLRTENHNLTVNMARTPEGTYKNTYINDDFYANFFCVYSITGGIDFKDQLEVLLSEEMRKTYGHFLLIIKPKEFLKRVKTALVAKGKTPIYGFIKYSDIENRSGIKEYFEKPLRYGYQKEFRVAFQNTQEMAEVINIGSIEDISIILSAEECRGIVLQKNHNDVLQRLDSIREMHLADCVRKHSIYEDLRNRLGNNPDGESLSVLQDAKMELLMAQKHFQEFYNSLRIG